MKRVKNLIIKNYTKRVLLENKLKIAHLIKDEKYNLDNKTLEGLIWVDKFVKKIIIDAYISMLYKSFYSKSFKFIIIYEGGIMDKINKKANKEIPKSKGHFIPNDIYRHFLLIRDSEKESKYGLIYIDFKNELIIHDGPFELEQQSEDQNTKIGKNKKNSKPNLILQMIRDHLVEYKGKSKAKLVKDIEDWKYLNITNSSEYENYKIKKGAYKLYADTQTVNKYNGIPKE